MILDARLVEWQCPACLKFNDLAVDSDVKEDRFAYPDGTFELSKKYFLWCVYCAGHSGEVNDHTLARTVLTAKLLLDKCVLIFARELSKEKNEDKV